MNGDAWGIADAASFVAAIDKELEGATRENVELVRKGRLTDVEAQYVVDLLRDVRSDLAHAFGPFDPGLGWQRAEPAVSWRSKVRWMKRELDNRRANYPELVNKGRMTEADARLGIRTLAALVRLYWNQLFQWTPDPGPALDYLAELRRGRAVDLKALRATEGARLYRELVRKHLADVEAAEPEQKELLVA